MTERVFVTERAVCESLGGVMSGGVAFEARSRGVFPEVFEEPGHLAACPAVRV